MRTIPLQRGVGGLPIIPEGTEAADADDRAIDVLARVSGQLAQFGLEVIVFTDECDLTLWRIGWRQGAG